jgi:hypothetical protein
VGCSLFGLADLGRDVFCAGHASLQGHRGRYSAKAVVSYFELRPRYFPANVGRGGARSWLSKTATCSQKSRGLQLVIVEGLDDHVLDGATLNGGPAGWL